MTSHRRPGQPPTLVNATGEPVYVMVPGARPQRLPELPTPTVFTIGTATSLLEVTVTANGHREGVVSLRVDEQPTQPTILCDLPQRDGVLYLVDPETLNAFPHRTDFVVASTFACWTSPKLRKGLRSKNRKKQRKARRKDRTTLNQPKRWPLASVSRGPLPQATPDTPVLDL